MIAREFLINSFYFVGSEGRKRPAVGMLGLRTHKVMSDYISGIREDLRRHGEWLVINGMEVSLDISYRELETACGNG